MNIESIWMIIIAITTPVAAVVAFYIQLKNIKRVQLQNEKLTLEIWRLKDENKNLESQIQLPTDDDVKKYGKKEPDILFSMSSGKDIIESKSWSLFNIDWGSLLVAVFVVSFTVYLFYDIYRVGLWFINLF